MSLTFFIMGVLLIYFIDLRKLLRNKNGKATILICALILVAGGLAGIHLLGWPSPLLLLHSWLSPLGRMIWKS